VFINYKNKYIIHKTKEKMLKKFNQFTNENYGSDDKSQELLSGFSKTAKDIEKKAYVIWNELSGKTILELINFDKDYYKDLLDTYQSQLHQAHVDIMNTINNVISEEEYDSMDSPDMAADDLYSIVDNKLKFLLELVSKLDDLYYDKYKGKNEDMEKFIRENPMNISLD
jgi:hypothetical protein